MLPLLLAHHWVALSQVPRQPGARFALVGGGSPQFTNPSWEQAPAPGARKQRLLYKGFDTTFLQGVSVRARSGPIPPELQEWGESGGVCPQVALATLG